MKRTLFFVPFLLWSCSSGPDLDLPIGQVFPAGSSRTSLKAVVPVSPESLEVSMASLPDQVKRYHLGLAASRQLVEEARGRLEAGGVLQNPDLDLGFQTTQRFEDFMLTVGVSKSFPRTNRLLVEKRVSATLVEAARAEVRDVERLLIGEARMVLVEVLALRQRKALLVSQEQNARELVRFTEEAAVRGEGSPLDAGVALLEANRLENLTKRIAISEMLAMARLKPLLGMEARGALTIVGELSAPVLPMMNVTTFRRPDVEAARLRKKSAKEESDLAEARGLGDVEAGVYAGAGRQLDQPTGFEFERTLGVRVKIPLGRNPATFGRILESEARANRFELGALALQRVALAESFAAFAEMKEWEAMARQIKTRLLPLAEAQIEKTEEAREAGQVALREVLLAREQKLSLEMSYLEAVRDYHLAFSKYLTSTAQ